MVYSPHCQASQPPTLLCPDCSLKTAPTHTTSSKTITKTPLLLNPCNTHLLLNPCNTHTHTHTHTSSFTAIQILPLLNYTHTPSFNCYTKLLSLNATHTHTILHWAQHKHLPTINFVSTPPSLAPHKQFLHLMWALPLLNTEEENKIKKQNNNN